jgi:hypothetical protein
MFLGSIQMIVKDCLHYMNECDEKIGQELLVKDYQKKLRQRKTHYESNQNEND